MKPTIWFFVVERNTYPQGTWLYRNKAEAIEKYTQLARKTGTDYLRIYERTFDTIQKEQTA